MALPTVWEITFRLDGDYSSYDELVQAALNDDAYQKYFPGIASEVLLEQLKKFVQDPNNRPERDGIINGTSYKKENGFYRVYNHEQEVEKLIQFRFNELKYNGQLPIVADYTSFALHNKFYVSRERCEFISRLLNATIIATQNCLKIDYDVTKLGARKQTHKHPLATVTATTITSTASSSCPDGHSTDDEYSVNTDPQQSLSIVPTTLAKTLAATTKLYLLVIKKEKIRID
ncbi:unnamed protein product [Rotaria socialis]|uniref:Uncharacterized protein n=1 Tax=Rotaria socialis TaxID=392032 RepID=A0A821SDI3_9BILA|nr:unnamed protein product [Rotaria socialis]CAF4854981.1 unnamed protein product [Rotaria socialis]